MCRPPDVIPDGVASHSASGESDEELQLDHARWRAHQQAQQQQQALEDNAALGAAWSWNPMAAPGGRLYYGGNPADMYAVEAPLHQMPPPPPPPQTFQARQWLWPQHSASGLPKPSPVSAAQMASWSATRGSSVTPADLWPKTAVPSMAGGNASPVGFMMAQGIPCGPSSDVDYRASEMAAMTCLDGMTAEEIMDLDPKKYKRMMSNRASAKRSRQRKQTRLEELEIQSAKLRVENAAVTRRLKEATDQIRHFHESNERMQAEVTRLRETLQRAGVVVKPAALSVDEAGDAPTGDGCEAKEASVSLMIGQPSAAGAKRELSVDEDEDELFALNGGGGGSKRVKRTSPATEEEDGPMSPSGVTGSSAHAAGGDDCDAAAGVMAGRADAAGLCQGVGRDIETLADAEFLAGLIDCFDDGQPLEMV